MKRVLTLVLYILLGYTLLNAQIFTLKVVSEDGPLPCAYVFINGRAYCSADTTGLAKIPLSLLNNGDTISVSFVGAKDNFIIYDKKIIQKDEYTITLEQKQQLRDIVVQSKNRSMEYYRKYVNKRNSTTWYDEIHGDFDGSFIYKGRQKKVHGSVISRFLQKNYMKATGEKLLKINSNSDTSDISQKMRYCLFLIQLSQVSSDLRKKSYLNREMIVSYRGENNGKRIFLISRPLFSDRPDIDSHQTLIYVDKISKEITSSETIMLRNSPDINAIYSFSTDYKVDKKSQFLYPSKISGTITCKYKDREEVDKIEIFDTSYHRINPKR